MTVGADLGDITSLPVVDRAALDAIAAVDAELLGELVDCYRRDGRAHVSAIVAAYERQDIESVRSHAHAMKGASGTIGARRVQRLCAILQRAALEEAGRGVADLRDAFEASLRAISIAAS